MWPRMIIFQELVQMPRADDSDVDAMMMVMMTMICQKVHKDHKVHHIVFFSL